MLFTGISLKKKELIITTIFILSIFFVYSILKRYINFTLLIFILISLFIYTLIILLIIIYRKIKDFISYQLDNLSKEIEYLKRDIDKIKGKLYIDNLNFEIPLSFGGWAIDEDFAKIVVDEIIKREYSYILELGSGISTLIIAKIIKLMGKGEFISVEHDKRFFDDTSKLLNLNKLNEYVKLIYAPLKSISIDGKDWFWYDTNFINGIEKIDFLLIDGPPRYIQEMSRYPALPLLAEKFSENVVIYLDDGKREDEKAIIEKWKQIFSYLNFQYIDTSKGTWRISNDINNLLKSLITFFKQKNKIIFVIGGDKKWSFGNSRSIKFPEYLVKKSFNLVYIFFGGANQEYYIENDIFYIPIETFIRLMNYKNFLEEVKKIFSNTYEKYLLIELPIKMIKDILSFFKDLNFFIIYDIRDNWKEFRLKKRLEWLSCEIENEILKNSDLVITVSPLLKEKYKKFRPELIPNGYDPNSFEDNFSIYLKKGEVTLGYYGHLDPAWFDWNLVKYIAKKKINWVIHLIGYSEKKYLENLPQNIIYHGVVEHYKLKGYARNWDVAIIPFKKNNISKFCDPLKVYEYIYFGLSVVVYGIPHLSNYPNTYVAKNYNDFIKLIIKIKKNKLPKINTDKFILDTTYESRINHFLKLVENKKL